MTELREVPSDETLQAMLAASNTPTPERNVVERLADRLVPAVDIRDPEGRWVALSALVGMELLVSELLATLVYFALLPHALPWLLLPPWLHLACIPVARQGRVDLACHVNSAALTAFCLVIAWATGGADSAGLILLTTVPLIPISLMRWRVAAVWIGLCAAAAAAFYVPAFRPMLEGPGFPEGWDEIGNAFLVLVVAAVSLSVAWQVTETSARNADRFHATLVALTQASREANAGNEAKNQFLASMSHEIRTPLHGVLGLSGLLLQTPLDDTQREHALTLRKSATNLLDLVNEILDVTRIESGSVAIEPRPTAVRDIVAQVESVMRVSAADKGLRLEIDVDAALPPVVAIDGGRLRQVLYNLLGNAVKFTRQGEVRLAIGADVPATEDEGTLWLTVSDTGPGIPPALLPRVFDRFVREGTAGSGQPGAGLGLTITRQLVLAMGGTLDVESTLGEGTTFRARLPVRVTEETTLDDEQDTPPEVQRYDAQVLVAEDEPVNQRVARAMLERLGCHVEVVSQGEQAVTAASTLPFDLVFLDCEMPVVDGFGAARGIRALDGRRGKVPIVAMTAHVLPATRSQCIEAGMDDFVGKPYGLEQLAACLQRWCPERRLPPGSSEIAER